MAGQRESKNTDGGESESVTDATDAPIKHGSDNAPVTDFTNAATTHEGELHVETEKPSAPLHGSDYGLETDATNASSTRRGHT